MRELWPHFGIELDYREPLDLVALFGHKERYVLEIGFGLGDVLVERAKAHPNWGVLGVEVHKPGVGAALLRITEAGCENVRVARIDAIKLLNDHLVGACLDEVWVFFPDPFPKSRDQDRRIMRPLLLELLTLSARDTLDLYVATDVPAYMTHVDALIASQPRWTTVSTERPTWRLATKYEEKGIAEGRPPLDRHFRLNTVTESS
ncbi:MAG TPA: tRNA (guanosine(46)-N7)-methyltransferase TrmB [Nannocystis exedens]|nr:tRNA (guanosine(46)-N7)-methyltransferase TrmB [Nannocystis exedens]